MGLVSFMRTQFVNCNFAFCSRTKCNYFHKWRSETTFHLQCSICVIGPHIAIENCFGMREQTKITHSVNKINMFCSFIEIRFDCITLCFTQWGIIIQRALIEIKPGQFQYTSPFSRLKWNVNLIARGGPMKCVNISMLVIYFTVQFRSHTYQSTVNYNQTHTVWNQVMVFQRVWN